MLKKLLSAGVGLALFAAPALASAQSADVQAQIAALLAQIRQLTVLIEQLKNSQDGQSNCVDLSTNLTLGSNSPDVQMLQQYLIKTGVLDAQYNTGYYGFLTAQAVGKIQLRLGVVTSSNDAAYGIVGPRTRAAFACHSVHPPVSSPLSVSCVGSPYLNGGLGVSWHVNASGGSGSYAYQWTMSNDATITGEGGPQMASIMTNYAYPGIKEAHVSVNDGSSNFVAICNATVGSAASSGSIDSISDSGFPTFSGRAVGQSYVNLNIQSLGEQGLASISSIPVYNGSWNATLATANMYTPSANGLSAGSYVVFLRQGQYADAGYLEKRNFTISYTNSNVPANPVINKFYASPSSISAGASATLYWSASNTAQCGISVVAGSGPGLDLSHAVNSYDTTSVTTGPLTQSTSYELRCAPLTGATGGYAIQDITVNVTNSQTNPVVISSFTASSNWVSPGQQVTFSWNSNLTSGDIQTYGGGCHIEGITPNNVALYVYAPTTGSGSYAYTPSQSATYTLTCMSGGKDGSPMAQKQLMVQVTNAAGLPLCPADATAQRGLTGTFSCACPPGFAIKTVWGGPGYLTDNSDICTAGALNGQFSSTYGGEVDYELGPGQSSYSSWSYYGITSQSFGAWPGSFKITGPKG